MEITNPKTIRIEEYDYELPDSKIAKYPLEKRDSSKLLVYKDGKMLDSSFEHLPEYIPDNSLMLFNNTKVIQARMHFRKTTGALIEIFCLEPHTPNDYILNFQQTESCEWVCLVGNLKKWKEGGLNKQIVVNDHEINLTATKIQTTGDSRIIRFEWNNEQVAFSDILEASGELPIPPYLNRDTEESDKQTYQTVYSKIEGSVAAPTAGLHFTPDILTKLKDRSILLNEVTLHVGAGTFKPVKSETIAEHQMHSEFISVRRQTIEQILNHKGPIIAVGTTSVRTLESLYYIGELLENKSNTDINVDQWQPYQTYSNKLSKERVLKNILEYMDKNKIEVLLGSTQIIIAPGYEFKIVDGIVTNFHQPQSTLLLLVSAFVGDNKWHKIYEHALKNDYRFLSYGDSSLLLRS